MNYFLVKQFLIPIDAPSLNVVSQGMLFDGLKGFDIEAVGKRKFVKFCCDGFCLQGVNSPEGEVDIRCRRMTTLGA